MSQTPLGVRLEPTQLIEAAAEFINFVFLMWLLKRKKFDGQVFASLHDALRIERFLIEFLRGDEGRGEVFGGLISGTQLIAICLVLGGGLIWWLKSGSVLNFALRPFMGNLRSHRRKRDVRSRSAVASSQ